MYISDFKLIEILRDKMGEDEARTLVEYIESKVEDKYMEAKSVFATKEDLLKLELKILESIHKNNLDTQKLIADSKAETIKLISDSNSEIVKLVSDSRSENIKLISDSNSEIVKLVSDSRSENIKLISDSNSETIKLISDSKFDTIKWMFGMIIASTVAIIGTILTVMKMGGW